MHKTGTQIAKQKKETLMIEISRTWKATNTRWTRGKKNPFPTVSDMSCSRWGILISFTGRFLEAAYQYVLTDVETDNLAKTIGLRAGGSLLVFKTGARSVSGQDPADWADSPTAMETLKWDDQGGRKMLLNRLCGLRQVSASQVKKPSLWKRGNQTRVREMARQGRACTAPAKDMNSLHHHGVAHNPSKVSSILFWIWRAPTHDVYAQTPTPRHN